MISLYSGIPEEEDTKANSPEVKEGEDKKADNVLENAKEPAKDIDAKNNKNAL